MKEHEDIDAARPPRDEREALLMRLGGLAFAIYADEYECITDYWAEPAPLPEAPAAVLGVVPVRGRMRTLINPARLFEALGLSFDRRPDEHGFIASLVGDEQLALTFEMYRPVPLAPDDFEPPPDSPTLPVRAIFQRHGETVYLLDPTRLFDAAMSGTERRRRRAVNGEQ